MARKTQVLKEWVLADGILGSDLVMRVLTLSMDQFIDGFKI
jgi:hypothetical protein